MRKLALCCLLMAVSVAGFSQASYRWRIPAVGSGPGAYGSQWASDVYLFNPNATPIDVNVVLIHATGGFGPYVYTVPAWGSYTIEDAMAPFELQGAGALSVHTGNFAPFYVMSRTYNTESDGDTQGQDIAGQEWCANEDSQGEQGLLFLGIQQTAQFRTNMGFMAYDGLDLRVEVFEDDGTPVVAIPVQTAGSTAVQFNLSTYTGAAVKNGYAIAYPQSGSNCFNGYASVVDNGTQDGTYIGGQLITKPTP